MNTCAHADCQAEIHSYELACRTHWNQLPVRLRNRIWKHWRNNDTLLHRKAVVEAHKTWNPAPPPTPRCDRCTTPTDLTDHETGKPVCLTCAKADVGGPARPRSCGECGRPTAIHLSFGPNPPDLCLDCAIETLTEKAV